MLKAETFRCLEESENLDEFLRANTGGCSPLMFPTLLGLRLAEDFELGTRYITVDNWVSIQSGAKNGVTISLQIF